MNNNITQALQDIDLIGLASFFMQADNIKDNNQQKQINQLILQAIANEIDKLHKENDNIIEKLNKIEHDDKQCKDYLEMIYHILDRRL
jgi:hypothetical protein